MFKEVIKLLPTVRLRLGLTWYVGIELNATKTSIMCVCNTLCGFVTRYVDWRLMETRYAHMQVPPTLTENRKKKSSESRMKVLTPLLTLSHFAFLN